MVILNNSLLPGKYFHHEICNTIEQKDVMVRCQDAKSRDTRLLLYYRKFNRSTSLWLSLEFYSFMVSAWCIDFLVG